MVKVSISLGLGSPAVASTGVSLAPMSTSEYDCDQSDLSLTQPGGCMRTDRNCSSDYSVILDCRNGKLN